MAIDFTIVTAITPDYWRRMRYAMPTWTMKPQFKDQPLVVFYSGYDSENNDNFNEIRNHFPNVRFVNWTMPEYDSKRELMLSAFILGIEANIETPYFVKLDCDTYFTDSQDVFTESDCFSMVVGHCWGYTKPGWWIYKLEGMPVDGAAPLIRHERIASFCCLHETAFVVRVAQKYGARLPIPSHDTLIWWEAERSGTWKAKNVKKLGVATNTNWRKIKAAVTPKRKTLIYTVGYGDTFFRLAMMCMRTLRDVGYKGDAVLFSDREFQSDYCRVINVDTLPDKQALISGKPMHFHRRIGKNGGCPYDFFTIKYLPVSVINKSEYDFILYVDSDILFTADPTPIMQSDTVVAEYHGHSIFKNLKGIAKYVCPKDVDFAKTSKSWGGAAVGCPKSMYEFYGYYKKYYTGHLNEIPHDQPALNLCLLNNREAFKPKSLPNRKYWRHYWGNRKDEMEAEYNRRFS